MNTYKYTVFTPTFNRAKTLARVYESLLKQTYQSFEWLIVDDGSTDETKQLIEGWKEQATFSIRYHYQINSGKHIALNRGVTLAKGEFFLIVDSDDAFLPDALQTMLYWWEKIPIKNRDTFTGIVTRCQYETGEICGPEFTNEPLDTNALDLRYKHKYRQETWGFHRVSVLKQYPFPEDTSVKFVPENIVWDAIARKYKIRCINAPLRIFYQDLTERITKGSPKRKAAVKQYFLQMLNRDFSYFKYDPITFIKWALLYVRYSIHLRDWQFMHLNRFDNLGVFFLCALSILPGSFIYLKDISSPR